MVRVFEKAPVALQPGQISQPVKSQYGYHIIYRPTYAQVRDKLDKAMHDKTIQHAESLYVGSLDSAARMQMAKDGVPLARAVAKDIDAQGSALAVRGTAGSGEVT